MTEESTTPEREVLVRRSNEALARGDYDAVLALFAPNAVWDVSALGLGAFEGREAIRRFYEEWGRTYEDLEAELEEFRDLENGVTLAVVAQRGRPARGGSGSVELRFASVTIWNGSLIESASNFTDLDEARTARPGTG